MRKFLLLMMMLASVAVAHAGDYDYLLLVSKDNTSTAFLSSGLTITFSEGTLTVSSNGETQSFAVANLSKMVFGSNGSTGIQAISDEIGTGEVSVYLLSGVLYGRYENFFVAKSKLQKGVYIVKSKSKTLKITIQ